MTDEEHTEDHMETTTPKETDIEKCCRQGGVDDICLGYCLKEEGDYSEGNIRGWCGKWSKLITRCMEGTFICIIVYASLSFDYCAHNVYDIITFNVRYAF